MALLSTFQVSVIIGVYIDMKDLQRVHEDVEYSNSEVFILKLDIYP